MGYFSNGTEGQGYECKYCDHCVHQGPDDGPGCAVWMAHMLKNYDECNNKASILHMLIPRSKTGCGNEQCTMFISKARDEEIHVMAEQIAALAVEGNEIEAVAQRLLATLNT